MWSTYGCDVTLATVVHPNPILARLVKFGGGNVVVYGGNGGRLGRTVTDWARFMP